MQLSVKNSVFVFCVARATELNMQTHRLEIYSNQTLKLHRVNLTRVQLLYLGCDLDIKGSINDV